MAGRTDPAVEKSVREQSSVGLRVCGNEEAQREMQHRGSRIQRRSSPKPDSDGWIRGSSTDMTLKSVVLHWDGDLERRVRRQWKQGSDMSIVLLQPPRDRHIYNDTDYGAALMEDISQCTCLLIGPPSESFTRDKQDKQTNKTLTTFISSGNPVLLFFHDQHCTFSFLYYTAKTSQNCLVAIEGRKSLWHSGGKSRAADPQQEEGHPCGHKMKNFKEAFWNPSWSNAS